MKIKVLFQISFSLFFWACSNPKKDPKDIVNLYYKEGKFNGAIFIMKSDSIICDTILGYSDFDKKIPFQPSTNFYIASLSKPVTAIAIMLLQQKQLLSYDDKAGKYITGLPGYAQNITIRQLLTHTSGINDYETPLSGRTGLRNQDIMEWLNKQQALQFEPGTRFEYSNSGYIILSLIIENISKTTYARFLKDNIFEPLNMQNTIVYDETKPFIPNKAIGFNKEKQLDDYSILTTGDGGIYSTAKDLRKLDKALRSNTLLTKENGVLMYQPPILTDRKLSEYGFGWFIEDNSKHKIAKHTGGLNGFRDLFWRDLKNNITIIALTNQGDAFPLNNFLHDLEKSIE